MAEPLLLIVALILVVFCQTTLTCKLVRGDTQLCKSLEELAAAGSHPEWTKLVLKNPGTVEKKLLTTGTFKNVINLENLWIEGLVNSVEPAVFKQLPNLKILYLIENIIEELPDGIFDGLHLENLAIRHCQLKNIKPNTLGMIENINLVGNQIKPGSLFRNTAIRNLDLSNNTISEIEDCAFCGMKNLELLKLHNNSLECFEPVRILGEDSRIMKIGLDGNKLTYIPTFDSFPNLTGLSVKNNAIEFIEENSFANCPRFNLLKISGNKLKDIPANILPEFGDRIDPMFLYIDNNEIQCLSQELRDKVKKLRRITLNDNYWQCECLSDVLDWAKKRKAFVECKGSSIACEVYCHNKNNEIQTIEVP